MDRTRLVDYLAALTDAEVSDLLAESRGATHITDVKDLILRELRTPTEP